MTGPTALAPGRARPLSNVAGATAVAVALLVIALVFPAAAGWATAHAVSGSQGAAPAPELPASVPRIAAPAAIVPATGTVPMAVLGTIHVGGEPQFATYDAKNQFVYVPNWASSNVSVLHGNAVVATVVVGSIPFSTTYDPTNGFVYVVNEGSGNVSVINGTTVIANVPVGNSPQYATYDSYNLKIYVSNSGSASVTVINGTTVNATVHVGANPSHATVSGGSSGGGGGGGWTPAVHATPSAGAPDICVPNTGSGNVSVLGGTYGTTVVGTVAVGNSPQFGAYDPNNAWLYVPNRGSHSVSVLAGTSLFATVQVGTSPWSATFDPENGDVYVANSGSNNVSIIGGLSGTTVVGSTHVGTGPEFIALDPAQHVLLVPNTGSGNISVISGATLTTTLLGGSSPIFSTFDPANGLNYVQNFNSATITVVGPAYLVNFRSVGLPSGSVWSVSAGTPPVLKSNTTVGAAGKVSFVDPQNGTFPFTITPPTGFGVARVIGPVGTTQNTTKVLLKVTTVTVLFGLLETLYFNESNLVSRTMAPGSHWGVTLTPYFGAAGPASRSGTNTTVGLTGSMHFTVPKGAVYKYAISKPSVYRAIPSHGILGIPLTVTHTFTHATQFLLLTAVVEIKETGLAAGTLWYANVTGPMTVNISNTATVKVFHLENGTYTFHVLNTTGKRPSPASGSFVVTVPSAPAVISIVYHNTPSPFASSPEAAAFGPGAWIAAAAPVGREVV